MDFLQPILTPEQSGIVKSYGGWTQFMICVGLKPSNPDDEEEGIRILNAFLESDGAEEAEGMNVDGEEKQGGEEDKGEGDKADLPYQLNAQTATMPATDGLQPPLTPAERTIVKSYGGWTNFMHSMCLKPTNDDDAEEGKRILEAFVAADEEQKGGKVERR
ncbi:hypothetical protein CDD80_6617 [Ophiocordyceps camponoti-rufipedis]|uniref:Uncharacterized protein n=1 Tax=Ophiocordyceps camponoti-rufipedis TaxID=2004952 RepID=A0A2C5YLF7_9HYPO|nr:hypothetical protein CDD80_6617 [Ophiocordyceps camponoti-rufipedis]